MSTHNVCFHGEIRKILFGYLLLSGDMVHIIVTSHSKLNTYIPLISGQLAWLVRVETEQTIRKRFMRN